ncbi:MAG: L-arabinose isomerase [Candidatus Ancillula sp.]|nr:L-arabinose isomerase [Candidatus Ancillula sp.]
MKNPFEGKEVWFFVGSQDLYGEEALRQVAEQSKVICDYFNQQDIIPAKIVLKPTLKSSDAIREAFLEAGANENCIGIMCWMHTFSPAKMWIRGLQVNNKPLLQLNTQLDKEIPWDVMDMDYMNLNQAAHGDREFGFIVSRLNIPRKVVVGHYTNDDVCKNIGIWTRACIGWYEINHLKVCRIGDNMRNVAVTEGDKTEAEKVFGVSVNTWSSNELAAKVHEASDEQVNKIVDEYLDGRYEVAPELQRDGARFESLVDAARIEAGLRNLLEENDCMALTDNFEDLADLKQLPGIATQRLFEDGYGFSAEGDWKTAILVRVANVMGYGRPGGAGLMEDYCMNFVEGQQAILGAHMLEVSPTLTDDKPRLEIHPLGIGGKEDPVRLVFNATPKEDAMVIALSDFRDRWRLVLNMVNVIKPYHDLPKLPVARALWQPKPSLPVSAECWLRAGAAHHTVMVTSTCRKVWEDFARIADVELAEIDENTTVAQFEKDLKLNNAYYKFENGF